MVKHKQSASHAKVIVSASALQSVFAVYASAEHKAPSTPHFASQTAFSSVYVASHDLFMTDWFVSHVARHDTKQLVSQATFAQSSKESQLWEQDHPKLFIPSSTHSLGDPGGTDTHQESTDHDKSGKCFAPLN